MSSTRTPSRALLIFALLTCSLLLRFVGPRGLRTRFGPLYPRPRRGGAQPSQNGVFGRPRGGGPADDAETSEIRRRRQTGDIRPVGVPNIPTGGSPATPAPGPRGFDA